MCITVDIRELISFPSAEFVISSKACGSSTELKKKNQEELIKEEKMIYIREDAVFNSN